jgi:metal-sulfur cluster biosynthetic enzyme
MIPTTDQVLDSIRTVTDPELGINVVDLGLIYEVKVEGNAIRVRMTLTSPGCPMAGMIASDVEEALRQGFPGREVSVDIVWDPPWTTDRLSAAARAALGYVD